MVTDPADVREQIDALLADVPEHIADGSIEDVNALAARLEEAHEVLVRALEAVDKRPGKDR